MHPAEHNYIINTTSWFKQYPIRCFWTSEFLKIRFYSTKMLLLINFRLVWLKLIFEKPLFANIRCLNALQMSWDQNPITESQKMDKSLGKKVFFRFSTTRVRFKKRWRHKCWILTHLTSTNFRFFCIPDFFRNSQMGLKTLHTVLYNFSDLWCAPFSDFGPYHLMKSLHVWK